MKFHNMQGAEDLLIIAGDRKTIQKQIIDYYIRARRRQQQGTAPQTITLLKLEHYVISICTYNDFTERD